ncbi:PIGQ family protein [Megaselia abdita]
MKTKIFFPENLFYFPRNCEVYGSFTLTEHLQTIYVAGCESGKGLQSLGTLSKSESQGKKTNIVNFKFTASPNSMIIDHLKHFNKENKFIDIFLYQSCQFNKLTESSQEDFQILSKMHQKEESNRNVVANFCSRAFDVVLNVADWKPLETVFNHMAIYSHYKEWKQYKQARKKVPFFTLDRVLGVISMILLLYFVKNPGYHLMNVVDFVIERLRMLLDSLKGNPAGLKLNVHLNKLLLSCFNYHIDLWEIFLYLIKPTIPQLFIPVAILGVFGISFQLAMLTDIIILFALHAHCFYIYASALYKLDHIGIKVLWKILLGKKKNPLKNRVESYDYMDRQLYLATMFFASLLFLMPTILVYYFVFTLVGLPLHSCNSFIIMIFNN